MVISILRNGYCGVGVIGALISLGQIAKKKIKGKLSVSNADTINLV